MQIERIINSVFSSNTFILSDSKENSCWLIDIGDVKPALERIGSKKLKGVFLTHTHYDHIYGINQLLEYYPDCVVYTSVKGKEGLFSDKLNFSRYHGDPIIFKGLKIYVVSNSEQIGLFEGVTFTVLLTPGHDWSCVSYYTDKEIFTGDSYIPNVKLITSLPHSNKDDAKKSLDKIMELCKIRDIYPGHNNVVLLKEQI